MEFVIAEVLLNPVMGPDCALRMQTRDCDLYNRKLNMLKEDGLEVMKTIAMGDSDSVVTWMYRPKEAAE